MAVEGSDLDNALTGLSKKSRVQQVVDDSEYKDNVPVHTSADDSKEDKRKRYEYMISLSNSLLTSDHDDRS